MKSLFISPYLTDGSTGGGLVSRMNLELLRQATDVTDALALSNTASSQNFTCIGAPSGTLATAICNLLLIAGRLKPRSIVEIVTRVRHLQPDVLFLDSSSLGWLALLCRIVSRRTKIISFFHNIEFDFQLERSRAEGRQYLLAAIAEYVSEWLTTKFSTHLLMLTKDDSQRALKLYGRPADRLTPVVLDNASGISMVGLPRSASGEQISPILFVGSNFFANRQAVDFLVNQLAPCLLHLPYLQIWIVGSGFAPESWNGSIPVNVRLLGRVENLDEIYQSAAMVAVPIVSGAGMKVKVAEALMYGLPVIGTSLALRGYIDNSDSIKSHLLTASSPEEYKQAIQFILDHHEDLCTGARLDYLERFSTTVGLQRIKQVLNIS